MQEGCGTKSRLSGSALPLLRLSSTEEGETGSAGEEGKSCLTGMGWNGMAIEFEVEVEGAESVLKTVYESIKEEREEGVNTVFKGGLLSLYVSISGSSSNEIARLRAVVNTWLRLLKIAQDMVEVVANG